MSASSNAGSVQPELLVPPVPSPTPRVDGPGRASQWLAWIGVVPFFTFALLFLILPTGFLMVGAFQIRKATSHSPISVTCCNPR